MKIYKNRKLGETQAEEKIRDVLRNAPHRPGGAKFQVGDFIIIEPCSFEKVNLTKS